MNFEFGKQVIEVMLLAAAMKRSARAPWSGKLMKHRSLQCMVQVQVNAAVAKSGLAAALVQWQACCRNDSKVMCRER